jgi:hypothetical protein
MKIYQVEYYDIEEKKWKTFRYCSNLKKAYEQAQTIAGLPHYQKIYRNLSDEEKEENLASSEYSFAAQVIDTTPTAARIEDTVKMKISRHFVY